MYQLYDNDDIQYGEFISLDNCYSRIREYLKEVDFKSYYYRQNFLKDGLVQIDYGSYFHFFYIAQPQGESHE